MRKSIKIISSIFLSSMFMINGTLFAFATTDDINENLESKELCEALSMKLLRQIQSLLQ